MWTRRLLAASVTLAALAALAPRNDAAGGGDKAAARPAWEYKVVSAQDFDKLLADDEAFDRAEKEMVEKGGFSEERQRRFRLEYVLNKFGADGWELAGIVRDPKESIEDYYLKRPK